jgi:anti-sigma factor RsiW
MNRDHLLRDLPLLLDGELPPDRAAEVQAAVERDPELAQRARELRAVDRLLELHPSIEPGPGFVTRALLAAAHADAKAVRRAWWRKPGWGSRAAVAAAAAILIATGVFWRPGRTEASAGDGDVTLRDYGVLADQPQEPVPDAALNAAWREIESVSQIYLPLG